MKIIEAISDTNIGGAGRLLIARLKESDRSAFDTLVILPEGSMLCGELERIGIRVRCFRGGADKSFSAGAVLSIIKIIKEEHPDMINAHGCLAARVAALIGGVKGRIYTRHCYYTLPKYMKKFPIRQMVGVANTLLSSRVIAVADAAKENLTDMGISEERVSVIINGVEGLRKYSAEERERERRALGIEGRFCVGICARIEDCKGHDTFLRAARILLGRSDKYRFLIVGDGSERARTEALASALGIRDKVIFTGFCRDVERYFNCMDVNVNCSRGTETSSLALSEGMSIGLPAVVSDYGGNAYMVRDGENGFVYGTGDFFTLAEKTERLASDVGLYRRMSEQAYDRYLSELNSKNMTEQTERLYRQIYEECVESARR